MIDLKERGRQAVAEIALFLFGPYFLLSVTATFIAATVVKAATDSQAAGWVALVVSAPLMDSESADQEWARERRSKGKRP
ncbi:hypothetical protein D3C76_809720 [compost metagenome]